MLKTNIYLFRAVLKFEEKINLLQSSNVGGSDRNAQ